MKKDTVEFQKVLFQLQQHHSSQHDQQSPNRSKNVVVPNNLYHDKDYY